MATGSCLCGTVRWQMDGAFTRMTHCHCSMCRKAHGAPFATYLSGPRDGFSWVSGKEAVRDYDSSPGFVRSFCSICGSVVAETRPNRVAMPAGCMDDDPGIRPSGHIFVTDRAPWHTIADELPQSEGYSWEGAPARVERPAPGPGTPGVLRGSCLCGDVTYEVRVPFRAIQNCHCSRCRKARAAAHTTNGFTPMSGVVFTRGEDKLVSYKVPDAKFFTHTFCRTCGSPMPRLDPGRDVAVVPLGSLDDDPGEGAGRHIFVASKASWYEITDGLPCFDEGPPPL